MPNQTVRLNAAFRAFVESAPVLCLAADRNFITFYVNPFYQNVHSISLEEAKGKHIREIIGEEGFIENLEFYNRTLAGEIVIRSGSFYKLDGTIHHYQATYAPIYEGNEITGITGVVLDTTSEIEIVKALDELQTAKARLEELASIDPLTGLNNRRFFSEISRNAIHVTRRNRSDLSFILVDIDHFKSINDTYGHDAGDAVLIRFSKILKDQIRESDVACRYGGEEFVVMLPQADLQSAATVAEKIRSSIEEAAFRIEEGPPLKITASFGVAALRISEETEVSGVISRADKALYEAKRAGRNRVVLQETSKKSELR